MSATVTSRTQFIVRCDKCSFIRIQEDEAEIRRLAAEHNAPGGCIGENVPYQEDARSYRKWAS